jgi:hypothetical protein
MSPIQEETELEFPWMNLHHRVLEADGHRINQGQVGQSYKESRDQEETELEFPWMSLHHRG